MDKFKIAVYWIFVGISFGWGGGIMWSENIWLAFGWWVVGVVLAIIGIANWLDGRKLESLEDSICNSKLVWGLWHTGVQVVDERLTKNPQITRILLPQINGNNPALQFQTNLSGSNDAQIEMRNISNMESRVKSPDRLRGYLEPFSYAFTIFDKKPSMVNGELQPTSKKAWVLVQILEPDVDRVLRHKYVIKNKGKERAIRYFKMVTIPRQLYS